MEDISLVYNIDICRFCQFPGNLDLVDTTTLTSNGNQTYMDVIKYIFGDIVWVEDQFISMACRLCLSTINDIAEFKKICKETNYKRGLLNFLSIKNEDDSDLHDGKSIEEIVDKKQEIGELEKNDEKPPRKRRTTLVSKNVKSKRAKNEDEFELDDDDVKLEHSDSGSDFEPIIKTEKNKIRHINKKTMRLKRAQNPKNRGKTNRTKTVGIICDICSIPCISVAERDRHVYNQHDGIRTHVCDICGKGYITKDDLSGHIKTVHADKVDFKFECEECEAKFYKVSALQRHTEAHHYTSDSGNNFSCTSCGNKYSTKGNLKVHLLKHPCAQILNEKAKTKQITHNSLDENSQGDLETAESNSTHDDSNIISLIGGERKRIPKPHTINKRPKRDPKRRNKTDRTRTLGITCDVCKIPCISLAERDRHVYNQHNGARSHICAICGRSYITKDDLTGHMKLVHADKEEYKYLCTECGAKFYKLSILQKHVELRHKHVRKFSCTVCGRLFTTNGNLKSHMLTHTDVRDFKCQFCPAEYKRKDCYLIHMTQKHGVGSYKCNRNLKEKNYACTMCEQRFNTRPRLAVHIKKHHTDVEPFCSAH